MAHHLDKPRTIGELAEMFDIPHRKLYRQLMALNGKEGGRVLTKFNGRKKGMWWTNLRTLQEHLPGMFKESRASKEEVERLREDVAQVKKRQNALAASQREFQKKAWEWFQRMTKVDQSRTRTRRS